MLSQSLCENGIMTVGHLDADLYSKWVGMTCQAVTEKKKNNRTV